MVTLASVYQSKSSIFTMYISTDFLWRFLNIPYSSTCGTNPWFKLATPKPSLVFDCVHARIQRGAGGPDTLKNHKTIGFLSNTGPDPLTNHKATKPAFNVGSSSARQRNAI